MSIQKTIEQYKTLEQLQQFAIAQQTTIIQMSKKIQKLEDERNHLKDIVDKSVPIIKSVDSAVTEVFENNAEYICHMEIAKLKEASKDRELTLEESRKLETYFRIITQIDNKPKPKEKEVEKLGTEELLKIVKK